MKMSGSEALLEALRLEGTTLMPGLVGSSFMDMLDITHKAGIRYLPMRTEPTAGYFAQGYSRVTGEVGICIAQNGPGVSNLATSVRDAYLAHAPVVVITPSTSTAHVDTDAIQELDAMALLRPCVGYQTQVSRPSRIAESVRAAFRAAYALNRPAQVDIPRDYLFGVFENELVAPEKYRDHKLGPGDTEALQRAAELLQDATHPVILAGWGVVNAGAVEKLARFSEALTAPVATSYLHNDAFPASHQLSLGPVGYGGSRAAMEILKQADVVLALGTRISEWGTLLPRYDTDFFPHDARLIHVDANPLQLGRTVPFEVGLVGDAGATLDALQGLIDWSAVPSRGDLTARVEESKAEWGRELAEMSSSNAVPISPRRAISEIVTVLPGEAIVATDIGNVVGVASAYLTFNEPRKHIAALGYGGCGAGYGLALGAKSGEPELPVVALIGDGSWGFSLVEVLTAVQEDIPVVAVILDNSQWGAEKRNQVEWYENRYVGTVLDNPNFAAIADLMGAWSVRVEKPSEVSEAVHDALMQDRPSVVHVVLDPSELGEAYRRDVMSSPTRIHPRYAT